MSTFEALMVGRESVSASVASSEDASTELELEIARGVSTLLFLLEVLGILTCLLDLLDNGTGDGVSAGVVFSISASRSVEAKGTMPGLTSKKPEVEN